MDYDVSTFEGSMRLGVAGIIRGLPLATLWPGQPRTHRALAKQCTAGAAAWPGFVGWLDDGACLSQFNLSKPDGADRRTAHEPAFCLLPRRIDLFF